MTRISKLYERVAANPRAFISFREFELLLEAFGFVYERTTGSHRHYSHPKVPWVLTVQPEGKDAKRYQVKRLIDMVAEYKLRIDA